MPPHLHACIESNHVLVSETIHQASNHRHFEIIPLPTHLGYRTLFFNILYFLSGNEKDYSGISIHMTSSRYDWMIIVLFCYLSVQWIAPVAYSRGEGIMGGGVKIPLLF